MPEAFATKDCRDLVDALGCRKFANPATKHRLDPKVMKGTSKIIWTGQTISTDFVELIIVTLWFGV